jgi:hypothetical protein
LTIDNLKQLKALISLCRKTGIESIKVDNVELHLGSAPIKLTVQPESLDPLASMPVPEPNLYDPIAQARAMAAKATKAIQDKIDTPDELTEEQLLNWSSRPEEFERQ